MPPLGLHMAMARRIGLELGLSDGYQGEYILGSTAPDIRVLTKTDRRLTHFFDLWNFEVQSGRRAMFSEHPEIADAKLLDPATRAFMTGYLTHLEADEAWILDIYRPYFGADSPLAGSSQANVLDRIIQFEMEQDARADAEAMGESAEALRRAVLDVECGFLDRETLLRWREITVDVASRPPDWARFRQVASRHLKDAGLETVEAVDAFMETIPELLEETRRHVSRERLEQFLEDAHQRSREAVREYLQ
ncbi:MAG: hypothetical protein GEU28_04215 [Dehalococcoidia bacterium]|nr:hypothetical protein [Dehalococcoidia bacterium]